MTPSRGLDAARAATATAATAPLVWWRDRLVPQGEAVVAARSAGVVLGVMPYETLRIHRRQPIHLQAHLDRFERSCRVLGFEPLARDDIQEALEAVIAQGSDGALARVTAVPTAAASGFEVASDELELLVATRPLPAPVPQGLRTITAPFEALPPRAWVHGAKVTGRATSLLAKTAAKAAGAHEALFQSPEAGYTEGTSTNLFVVHSAHLVTPPTTHGLLPGLTREWVLTEARRMDLVTHHMRVTLRDLLTADEVFLTGTGLGVAAAVSLDGRPIGGGAEGPVVAALRDAHAKHLDEAAGPA